jgi:hypothetical protein
MNARERLELSHFRPETYRTLRDAGIENVETREDRAIRLVSVAGWVFFLALMGAVLFGG